MYLVRSLSGTRVNQSLEGTHRAGDTNFDPFKLKICLLTHGLKVIIFLGSMPMKRKMHIMLVHV